MMELHLLRGPYALCDAKPRPIPTGAERLVVLVALRGPIRRRVAARLLWPNVDSRRAAGNLRSSTWRLRAAGLDLVCEVDGWLAVDPEVSMDVHRLCEHAARLSLMESESDGTERLEQLVDALNILPGWYDDWLVHDRERIRGLMLDALDQMSAQLHRAGRSAEAIDTALIAVMTDPLRESSQAVLLRAHLSEGNVSEARRAYQAYRAQLKTDVGLEPSISLMRMITSGSG
jgi:DNA-binding SARP family transcriptional activator